MYFDFNIPLLDFGKSRQNETVQTWEVRRIIFGSKNLVKLKRVKIGGKTDNIWIFRKMNFDLKSSIEISRENEAGKTDKIYAVLERTKRVNTFTDKNKVLVSAYHHDPLKQNWDFSPSNIIIKRFDGIYLKSVWAFSTLDELTDH